MNRTLGVGPLITAVIAIAAIMIIGPFNMYLFEKHKKSYYTICVHSVSLFTILGLIYHMLKTAVFVLPISESYARLSRGFFILVLLSVVFGIISALTTGRQHGLRNLPNSIPDALKNIDATVFVVDRDGIVTHINHPETYHSLFGDSRTLKQLFCCLKTQYNVCTKAFEMSDSFLESRACELYFDHINMHFMFRLTPIYVGVGFIGYTAVLEDISVIKNSEKKLEVQNEDLRQANTKLTQYIRAAGALEAEQERLQILTQVQKTLIRDIEIVLLEIRSMKRRSVLDGILPREMHVLAAQLREIYQTVRCAVGQISGKDVNL